MSPGGHIFSTTHLETVPRGEFSSLKLFIHSNNTAAAQMPPDAPFKTASTTVFGGIPDGSVVKNTPAMQETQVWSLGQEDPLEKDMATHSSIIA